MASTWYQHNPSIIIGHKEVLDYMRKVTSRDGSI